MDTARAKARDAREEGCRVLGVGGVIHFLQGSCSGPQALPSPVTILGKP